MPSPATIALWVVTTWIGSALAATLLRSVRPNWISTIGFSLLPVVATAVGTVAFRGWPHFPPREDVDRLMLIGLPFVVIVCVITAGSRPRSWWVRAAAVAAMVRLVLHGSSYVSPTGGDRAWSFFEQSGHLVVWSAVATVAWWLSDQEVRNHPAVNTGYRLALATLASGVVAVISGYISVGLGLVVLGAAALGWAWGRGVGRPGTPGDAVESAHWLLWVALLAAASYFADLPLWAAWGLLAVPALSWLTFLVQSTRTARWRPVASYVIFVFGTAVLVAGVFWHHLLHNNSSPASSGQPTIQDYMSFPGDGVPIRRP
ncbi:MAG: hypothetical protein KatS3mg110_2778 [Pirellulaceae bacterium]|nr:MAG: hypothetical protein KatS3mg110_2778 [Pirellulaceae bacterium]